MKSISIKFEVTELKSNLGRKTGVVKVKLGDQEVFAKSREELEQKIHEWIVQASKAPLLSVVRVGDTQSIVMSHQGCSETLRLEDDAVGDGIFKTRCTSVGNLDHKTLCDSSLMHLMQCEWQPGDSVPASCPEHLRADFESWIKFQNQFAASRVPAVEEALCEGRR